MNQPCITLQDPDRASTLNEDCENYNTALQPAVMKPGEIARLFFAGDVVLDKYLSY